MPDWLEVLQTLATLRPDQLPGAVAATPPAQAAGAVLGPPARAAAQTAAPAVQAAAGPLAALWALSDPLRAEVTPGERVARTTALGPLLLTRALFGAAGALGETAAGATAQAGFQRAAARQALATEPSVLGGFFGHVPPGTSIPEQILGPGPAAVADTLRRLPFQGVEALPVAESLANVARRLQYQDVPGTLDLTRRIWHATPEGLPGQKFLAENLANPTSYLGLGLGPAGARVAPALGNPALRSIVERAAALDTAYGEAATAPFAAARAGAAHLPEAPLIGRAFQTSPGGQTAQFKNAATNFERQSREFLDQAGVDGSVFRQFSPQGEGGPLTMTGRRYTTDPLAAPFTGTPRPSAAPVKGAAATPAPAAQAVLDALTPAQRQAWADQALQGLSVPANRTPEQAAWHRWQQMAEGDLRDADKAARYFGVPTQGGQPRDLRAILDAATARTGDDGAAALDLARQHAAEVGITPPRYRTEGGRQFSTRGAGSGPAKHVLETTGDVRTALKQLGADDDTIYTAQARFIYDRYGDTLPVNPTGVKGYNDAAVALRLQRETGATAEMPPVGAESAVAPSSAAPLPDTPPPPSPPADLTPPVADTAAGVVPPHGTANGTVDTANGTASALADLALPRGLKGGAPRYGYGRRNFTLEFASDVDKALYIVAQDAKRSARDADYLAFLQNVAPGMDEAALRQAGQRVRDQIKVQAAGAPTGQDALQIPRQFDALLGVRVQAPAAPASGLTPGRQPVNDILSTLRTAENDPAATQAALDAAEAAGAPLPLVDELRVADRAYQIAKTESLDPAEIGAARDRLNAAKQALQDAATPGAPTVTTQPRPPVPDDIAARLPAPDAAIPLGPDLSSLRTQMVDYTERILGPQSDVVGGTGSLAAAAQQRAPGFFEQLDKDRQALADLRTQLATGGQAQAETWDELLRQAQSGPFALARDKQKAVRELQGRYGRSTPLGAVLDRGKDDALALNQLVRDRAYQLGGDRLANQVANGPRWWQDLGTIMRQVALITPRWLVQDVADATIKSGLTMGQAGFTPGARPWQPGELAAMFKHAWSSAGDPLNARPGFSPLIRMWERAHPGIALPAEALEGSLLQPGRVGRGLQSEKLRLGPVDVGRGFRAWAGLDNVMMQSARSAAFMDAFDKAVAQGADTRAAYQAGLDFMHAIHYDTTARTNLDEWLSKVTLFHLWATRNLAKYPELLATHPGFARAVVQIDQQGKEQAEAGGYQKNKRLANSVAVGGPDLTRLLFDRDGKIFFDPLAYVSIASQIMQDPRTAKDISPLGQGLNLAARLGVGPAPWVQAPLGVAGVYGTQQPSSLVPFPYTGAITGGLAQAFGRPFESPDVSLLRGAQTAVANLRGEAAPSGTDLPVQIRLAEMALEQRADWAQAHPLSPIAPEYAQAIQQGAQNPLWQEAAKQLGRQQTTERTLAVLGAPVALQSAGAGQMAQAAAGIPDRNALGGWTPLDPIERLAGTDPTAPLVTSKLRQQLLEQRALAGQPAALALNTALSNAPQAARPESQRSRDRDAIIQAYFNPRTSPEQKAQLMQDPRAAAWILAEAMKHSPLFHGSTRR